MRKVAQAQAAHDVAAETCETAAQPIEQGSKRVSNSVRGVGSGLKVFISHCKRISGTEDKAIWIADVLDSSEAEVKAWFDRSHLSEITMDSLKQAVDDAAMLITILDPCTFDSEWVRAENEWARDAGLDILPREPPISNSQSPTEHPKPQLPVLNTLENPQFPKQHQRTPTP